MLELIGAAAIGGSAVFGAIWAYGRIEYWKGMYETAADDRDNIMEKAMYGQKENQALSDKYSSLHEFMKTAMSRPVVAALTDDHVREIASTLANLVMTQQNPNRLN